MCIRRRKSRKAGRDESKNYILYKKIYNITIGVDFTAV